MQEIAQTIQCTLPNFEGVTITFNLMATADETDVFIRRMGQDGTHEPVVARIEGWPKEYGADPWSKEAPVVFRAWIARTGWGKAMKEWLDSPNS